MILAHLTASSSASTVLVIGIALLVMGFRGNRRFLLLGVGSIAAGLVLSWAHAG